MLKVCVPVYWYSELIHPISFDLSYIFFFHITVFEVRIQLTMVACHSLIGNISLYGTKIDGKLPVISVLDSVQCSYLLSWCSLLFRAN